MLRICGGGLWSLAVGLALWGQVPACASPEGGTYRLVSDEQIVELRNEAFVEGSVWGCHQTAQDALAACGIEFTEDRQWRMRNYCAMVGMEAALSGWPAIPVEAALPAEALEEP